MAEAKRGELWEHSAYLAAMNANLYRKEPLDPDKINPFIAGRRKREAINAAKDQPRASVMDLARMLGAKERRT